MSNLSIAIAPYANGFAVSLPVTALILKREALAKAEPIKAVTNGEEQTAAIQATAVVKGLLAQMEKTREEVKKPYWDAGKAIDAKAKEFALELEREAKRLESLIAGFQRAERERIEAAEREVQRQREEAEAAARAEQERLAKIEADRIAAEQAAAAAKGRKAKEAAEAAAARLREEEQEARLAASEAEDDAAQASNLTIVQPPPPAARGAATSFVMEFEVTDIDALYAWDLERRKRQAEILGKPLKNFPSIFKMELKKSDFKFHTQNMDDAELAAIPGVKFTKTAKVAVRAGAF